MQYKVVPVIKCKITPKFLLHLMSLIKIFPSKSKAKQYIKTLKPTVGISFTIKGL